MSDTRHLAAERSQIRTLPPEVMLHIFLKGTTRTPDEGTPILPWDSLSRGNLTHTTICLTCGSDLDPFLIRF